MMDILDNEIIVDLFAGGGGASEGIREALGRDPDIAVDHDAIAVAMHKANHSGTKHYRQDVWSVLPRQATKGRPVGLLWASPDCTHFSKAKGGPPIRDSKKRDLAWAVVRWAEEVRPRVIMLENVEEFLTWGPLDCSGKIIRSQRGVTFKAFVKRLKRHGYAVEWECLKACDYGAPTSRTRLFIIARCDGKPIVWPVPTHGNPKSKEVLSGQLLSWRTAAEIIDWSLPCPSIFDRKKLLAENTLKRITEGMRRYVIKAEKPFIVGDAMVPHSASYYGLKRNEARGREMERPIATITGDPRHSLVTGYPSRIGQTGGSGKYCNSAAEPLTTVTSKAEHLFWAAGLQKLETPGMPGKSNRRTAAWMAQHNGGMVGHEMAEPVSTLTHSCTQQQLVACSLMNFGMPPVSVLNGRHAEVRAFLVKYFGTAIGQAVSSPLSTVTGKAVSALVVVNIEGEPWMITDIGMRMLTPRELFLAQGFPANYRIDVERPSGADKDELRSISKTVQVRLCGNSVPPNLSKALVAANFCRTEVSRMRRQLKIF